MPKRKAQTFRRRQFRPGAQKFIPGRNKPNRKKLQCVARVHVQDLQVRGSQFEVTVCNKGNLPAYPVRVNVYRRTLISLNGAAPVFSLVASTSLSLGILEEKTVRFGLAVGAVGFFKEHLAIAFDPINDPFPIPTNRLHEMAGQEHNLLFTSQSSLPGWSEFKYQDGSFDLDEAVEVRGDDRTWKVKPMAEVEDEVPGNSAIERVFHPQRTPTAFSELQFHVDLRDDPFFSEEIQNGNVDLVASRLLYTFAQNPRDQGALWLRVTDAPAGLGTVLADQQPQLIAASEWHGQTLQITLSPHATTVCVRLIAARHKGQSNDAYFANVTCMLKHRQAKLLPAQIIQGLAILDG